MRAMCETFRAPERISQVQSPTADSQSWSGRTDPPFDRKTADRQLHLLREGCKRGLGFAALRQLVAKFYGAEIKPCQLHWTEIDRLIIELWRQDLRGSSPSDSGEVIDFSRWREKRRLPHHHAKA
jgi:hypothetical protein